MDQENKENLDKKDDNKKTEQNENTKEDNDKSVDESDKIKFLIPDKGSNTRYVLTPNYVENPSSRRSSRRIRPYENALLAIPNSDRNLHLADGSRIFGDIISRHRFIRRVYAILTGMILLSSIVPLVVKLVPSMEVFMREYWYLLFIPLVADIILIIILHYVKAINRKFPFNMIFLLFLVVSHSFLIAFICVFHYINEILVSLAISIIIFFILTIFTFQTRLDFLSWWPYFGVTIIILMGVTIFGILLHSRVVYILTTGILLLCLCLAIIFDTQILVAEKRQYAVLTNQDYIFAAVILYLDFCLLFTLVLSCQRCQRQ